MMLPHRGGLLQLGPDIAIGSWQVHAPKNSTLWLEEGWGNRRDLDRKVQLFYITRHSVFTWGHLGLCTSVMGRHHFVQQRATPVVLDPRSVCRAGFVFQLIQNTVGDTALASTLGIP